MSGHDSSNRLPFGLRPVLIGAILIPVNAYWAAHRFGDVIISLLVPPLVTVFLLALLNTPLVRLRSRWALSQAELTVIYAMLTVATGIAAEWGFAPDLAGMLVWFDSPERGYGEEFVRHLPSWMVATDLGALEHYFGGHAAFALYGRDDMLAWWRSGVGWCGLIIILVFVMWCLLILLGPRWINQEKLSFPIMAVPMRVIEGGSARTLIGNRRFWFGALLGLVYDGGFGYGFWRRGQVLQEWKGLNLAQFMPNRPWSVIGWTPIAVLPFMVATCYFIPTDLSFSCVVFFWFRKLQQIVATKLGYGVEALWGGMSGKAEVPYLSEQSCGALLLLFGLAVWSARGYIVRGLGENLRGVGGREWSKLLQVAAWGLFLGLTGMIVYVISMRTSVPLMVFYLLVFLAISTSITKIRAEIGPPIHEFAYMGPNRFLLDVFGANRLGKSFVTVSGMLYFTHRLWRSHPMPQMVEGMKLADEAKSLNVRFFVTMLVAIVLGTLVMYWANLQHGYQWGGVGRLWYTNWIAQWRSMETPNYAATFFGFGGAAITLILTFLHHRFPGLPVHPAAYALCMNFGIDYCWFPMLLAGVIKWSVLRYGGHSAYRYLMPLAVGIIIGEYLAGTGWSWLHIITHEPTYSFSIN